MDSIGKLRLDRTRGDVGVFELSGDFDMANAAELEAALGEALVERRGIVLDLSGTTFIDSSIIHVLVRTQRALAGQDRQLALCVNTASIVRLALDIGMPDGIAVTSDRADAIAIATAPAEEAVLDGQA